MSNNTIVLVGQIINVTNNDSNTISYVDFTDGFGIIRINCLKKIESNHTELLNGINLIAKPYVRAVVKISHYEKSNICNFILNGLKFTKLNSTDLITYHFLSVTKGLMI